MPPHVVPRTAHGSARRPESTAGSRSSLRRRSRLSDLKPSSHRRAPPHVVSRTALVSARRPESTVGSRRSLATTEPTVGFEPTTCALRKHCSTTELSRPGGPGGQTAAEDTRARLPVKHPYRKALLSQDRARERPGSTTEARLGGGPHMHWLLSVGSISAQVDAAQDPVPQKQSVSVSSAQSGSTTSQPQSHPSAAP
jgi:hypothetical protein